MDTDSSVSLLPCTKTLKLSSELHFHEDRVMSVCDESFIEILGQCCFEICVSGMIMHQDFFIVRGLNFSILRVDFLQKYYAGINVANRTMSFGWRTVSLEHRGLLGTVSSQVTAKVIEGLERTVQEFSNVIQNGFRCT